MEELRYPTRLMLLIALLQGLALLLLHQSIDFEFWPATAPQWLFAAYALVIIGPGMYLLGVNDRNKVRLVTYIAPFAALCALLAFYTGGQAIPSSPSRLDTLLAPMTFTLALLTFKALMYVQVKTADEPFVYPQLFHYSWRNLLTLGLALAFTLVTWGVLMLWAGLFSVINIDFFGELFEQKWFYYPALNLALALGVILIRRLSVIVDTIKQLQQALLKYLLVLLVFVSVIFLLALPFTGLSPLWEEGPGSYLILWMQACLLFALNSVYQGDADEDPYSPFVHRFIYLGILLLPIYSGLVFYGLSLRVEQYGWSVSRYWGMIVWMFLALFSLGYVTCIVRYRDNWIAGLGRINVAMGWLLMLVMVLVNSPFADLRVLTADNQLARIKSGQTALHDIDIPYFANQLALPGYLAIEQLKQTYGDSHPTLALRLSRAYQEGAIEPEQDKLMVINSIECLNDCNMPSDLADVIYDSLTNSNYLLRQAEHLYLLAVDPDGDNQTDYLLMLETNYLVDATLYMRRNSNWYPIDIEDLGPAGKNKTMTLREYLQALEVNYRQPQYRIMQIGDFHFNVTLKEQLKSSPEQGQ